MGATETAPQAAAALPSARACTLCRTFPEVELSERDRARLWRWVTWEEAPEFPRPGRTAWMPLADPVPHPTAEGATLSALKLKGVGLSDGTGARPVTGEEEYLAAREQPHFGIGPDGRYEKAFSEPAPFGGIVLSRAFGEYDNAALLLRTSVPALVPVAVMRYEASFRGEPLGVAVTASPEPTPFRLTSIIAAPADVRSEREHAHRAHAERALALPGPLADPDHLAQAFATLAETIGAAVRAFADAGLYRYSSGWSNFQLCPAWGRLLLVDLDSCRPLAELTPERRGLEILRDAAGALHKIVEAIHMYPQMLRDVGLQRIVDRDPVLALLRGFFHDAPAEDVRRASAHVWGYALPNAAAADRRRRAADRWTRADREMHPSEKWTIYALGMMACRGLLERSELGRGCTPPPAAVGADRAAGLLGEDVVYARWAENQVATTAATTDTYANATLTPSATAIR